MAVRLKLSPAVTALPVAPKRPVRQPHLPNLMADWGPAVTPAQIARVTGMSHRFVLEDISLGRLKATNVGRGKRPVYRILFREAKRYAKRLGAI